jgi:hypothetical protein
MTIKFNEIIEQLKNAIICRLAIIAFFDEMDCLIAQTYFTAGNLPDRTNAS